MIDIVSFIISDEYSEFIPIENYPENDFFSYNISGGMIYGSIVIYYNKKPISDIDSNYTESLSTLWSKIFDVIKDIPYKDFISDEEQKEIFPYFKFGINLKDKQKQISIKQSFYNFEKKEVFMDIFLYVEYKEFFRAFIDAYEFYCNHMIRIVPRDSFIYEIELDKIRILKNDKELYSPYL